MLGTEEMVVYECTAANDALGNIVRDSLTLRVLCKSPVITNSNIMNFTLCCSKSSRYSLKSYHEVLFALETSRKLPSIQ